MFCIVVIYVDVLVALNYFHYCLSLKFALCVNLLVWFESEFTTKNKLVYLFQDLENGLHDFSNFIEWTDIEIHTLINTLSHI